MIIWRTQLAKDVLGVLSVSEAGLNIAETAARLQTYGPNELQKRIQDPNQDRNKKGLFRMLTAIYMPSRLLGWRVDKNENPRTALWRPKQCS